MTALKIWWTVKGRVTGAFLCLIGRPVMCNWNWPEQSACVYFSGTEPLSPILYVSNSQNIHFSCPWLTDTEVWQMNDGKIEQVSK